MERNYSYWENSDCSYDLLTGVSLTIASLIASLLGSLGNILVLLTICTSPSLQTLSNLFVVNLSIADMVVSVVALPMNCVWTIRKTQGHCLSLGILHSRRVFISLSSCASLVILGWVSVERCIVISWPLKYKWYITRGRIVSILAFSWLFSIIYGVLATFDAHAEFTAIFATAATTASYVVITVCYVRIFVVVSRQKQVQPALQVNSHHLQAAEKQLAKTMALVIGVFTICFAPLTVARLTSSKLTHGTLHDALMALALSHSVTNPLIYFYRSKDYRTAFKRIICCRFSRENLQQIPTRHAWTLTRNLRSAGTASAR